MDNAIAWRFWSKRNPMFYVGNLPEGKSDWGYVTDYTKAIPLNKYWQSRFRKDCERVGTVARFIEA